MRLEYIAGLEYYISGDGSFKLSYKAIRRSFPRHWLIIGRINIVITTLVTSNSFCID